MNGIAGAWLERQVNSSAPHWFSLHQQDFIRVRDSTSRMMTEEGEANTKKGVSTKSKPLLPRNPASLGLTVEEEGAQRRPTIGMQNLREMGACDRRRKRPVVDLHDPSPHMVRTVQ